MNYEEMDCFVKQFTVFSGDKESFEERINEYLFNHQDYRIVSISQTLGVVIVAFEKKGE